jgi:hypothetical protein
MIWMQGAILIIKAAECALTGPSLLFFSQCVNRYILCAFCNSITFPSKKYSHYFVYVLCNAEAAIEFLSYILINGCEGKFHAHQRASVDDLWQKPLSAQKYSTAAVGLSMPLFAPFLVCLRLLKPSAVYF